MYSQYGTNYDTSLATLQNLNKHNSKFSNFLQVNNLPRCNLIC